jgi:hypothetical protein
MLLSRDAGAVWYMTTLPRAWRAVTLAIARSSPEGLSRGPGCR